jgi:hypothetical protein
VCIAALHMPILIPLLFGVWLVGSYLIARTIYTGIRDERHAQLQALADDLAERLNGSP